MGCWDYVSSIMKREYWEYVSSIIERECQEYVIGIMQGGIESI